MGGPKFEAVKESFNATTRALLAREDIPHESRLFISCLPNMLDESEKFCIKARETTPPMNAKVFDLIPDNKNHIRNYWATALASNMRACTTPADLTEKAKQVIPWSEELFNYLAEKELITWTSEQKDQFNVAESVLDKQLQDAITDFYTEKLQNITLAEFLELPTHQHGSSALRDPVANAIPVIEQKISEGSNNIRYQEYKRYGALTTELLQFHETLCNHVDSPDIGSMCAPHISSLTTLINQPNYIVAYGTQHMESLRRSTCDRYFLGMQLLIEQRIISNAPHNKVAETPRTIVCGMDIPMSLPFGKPKGTRAQENEILKNMLDTFQLLAMRVDGKNNREIYSLAIETINTSIQELKKINRTNIVGSLEGYRSTLENKINIIDRKNADKKDNPDSGPPARFRNVSGP